MYIGKKYYNMNWYHKYKLAYDRETPWLAKALKGGFDPHDYDYDYDVPAFLEYYDPKFLSSDPDAEPYEIGEQWISQASEDQLKDFEEWIDQRDPHAVWETDEPPSRHFVGGELTKPDWLVHFTEDASAIASQGFKYGHEDYRGLGLTTWKSEEYRRKYPGFNFALELGMRNTNYTARQGKYGKEAVIFWGMGVKTFHSGDEEDQIIFWGPSINTNMIFPIFQDGEGWYVEMANGREVRLDDPSFENVADWVTRNWRMLQQTEDKERNIRRERRKKYERENTRQIA